MEKIEYLILRNLLFNEEYLRLVLPFIQEEYFQDNAQKNLFIAIRDFVLEYNKPPTKEILHVEIGNKQDLTEDEYKSITHIINSFEKIDVEFEWLMKTSEEWCKDRALYNAIMESVNRYESNGKQDRGSLPTLMQDALAVSFDTHIGHDYLEDYEQRYGYLHRKEQKVPFDLEYFDKITKGGLSPKTLTVALAGTGVGKSLFMCHFASSVLLQGRNVLYITLEMAEEKIAERIDANLLNVPIQELQTLPKSAFETKIKKLAAKTQGNLIIKEYPTASAHAGHFKSLLNDLALKKSFHPDIIFIDYLNICASSRYKAGSNVNTYTFVKAIAEEIRGIGQEFNVPIVSATQTTRSGYSSSDPDLTDTSESFGLPATADLMFALISSEQLEEMGQIMVKQLKNRDNDRGWYKKFCVGIDRSKMRLYDVEQAAQEGIHDSGQNEEYEFKEKPMTKMKEKFGGFSFE
jgi:replicative DNA helicase